MLAPERYWPQDANAQAGFKKVASMKLLLAEDDRVVRITVRDALEEAGYQVTACPDGFSALREAESGAFDLVLTDVRLPSIDGLTLFRRIRELRPDAAVLLMTAYANTQDAVAVIREGARDYIVKPFDVDELVLRLGRVRQELEFKRQMEQGTAPLPGVMPIRGTSAATQRLIERVGSAAASDVNVLLVGETGTGKDLCARQIHQRSRRAAKPFVIANCAAIPETLFESELFGHEKGAFTGADRRRKGRFETANGGTLFFDEVGELSLGSQAKLLRVLENSTFEPLGADQTVTVDVRVISATNRDLTEDIAKGAFRKDLYYRLNVIDIVTPPLRERRADIPILVSDFLTEISARQRQPVPALDPCAMAALAAYDFPGNVRELIHALERAVATSPGGVIRLEHLPVALAAQGPCGPAQPGADLEPLAKAVQHFERQYILRVLEKVGGRRGRAAEVLGMSRKTLWVRLKEMGIGEGEDEGD